MELHLLSLHHCRIQKFIWNKLTASSIPGSRNRWSASVRIDVVDDGGQPAANVFVEGGWSNGSNGGASCTTNGGGSCSVQKNNLKA